MTRHNGTLKTFPRNEIDAGFGRVMTGKLAAVDPQGGIWVTIRHAQAQPVPARTIVDLNQDAVGKEILLIWADEADGRPVIIGFLRDRSVRQETRAQLDLDREKVDDCLVDKKRIDLAAQEEIVLRCGECSLTLRKDGRIIIKGTHVISRARGINKIRGAAVSIN